MEKSPKKWSLGSILFRKSKKGSTQAEVSSDEDDSKAGFGDDFTKKCTAKGKRVKDQQHHQYQQPYSVVSPEFYFIKPSTYPQEILSQHVLPQSSLEFLKNQLNLESNHNTGDKSQYIHNNSFHLQQYQGSSQDEKSSYNSMSSPIRQNESETGSRTSLNKKTRNARNERYYQRIMREEGRPLTIYGSLNSAHNLCSSSKKSGSLCSSELMLPSNGKVHSLPIPSYRGNPFEDKDDYENIHEIDESVPPPIPPRDPNRRLSINSSSISQQPYYFDHSLQKYVVFNTNGKCVSDDRLWTNNSDPKSHRTSRNGTHQEVLTPRSRKPLNVNTNLDREFVFSSEDVVDGPLLNLNQQSRSKSAIDFENISNDALRQNFGVRRRNLTSVEPIRYQTPTSRDDDELLNSFRKKNLSAEGVNKKTCNSNLLRPPAVAIKQQPKSVFRKSLNVMDLKTTKNSNVSSNLDDAINELELMYKSLVADEGVMIRKYDEYENEENHNDKEPDILLDDVFSRNLKHANQMLKPSEPLPFGIPNHKLCPIPLKPSQDYLSVEPTQMRKTMIATQNNPDVVADDLAVRNLRKDNPKYSRRHNLIEIDNNHFMKRNHTLSSLSDEIYNGILKGATKPSGGKIDLLSIQRQERDRATDFEETLNALVVESVAISKKLEKDWSNLKSTIPSMSSTTVKSQPKTIVQLLSFRKSPKKELQPEKAPPVVVLLKEPQKPEVKTTSTACSPIKDIEINRKSQSKSPKHRAEKIENLIAMFNTSTTTPPESPKKVNSKVVLDKPSRTFSDSCEFFNKSLEVELMPVLCRGPLLVRETISLKTVSPTIMKRRTESPKVKSQSSIETTKTQIDVESNINNIKELIQQIKQSEFDNENRKEAPTIMTKKSSTAEMPDYDNIKEDYSMTDSGVLKRTKPAPEVSKPKESSDGEVPTRHDALIERTSSDSAMSCSAIYKNAIDFLNETKEVSMINTKKQSPMVDDQDKILSCIQRINRLGSVDKTDDEESSSKNKVTLKPLKKIYNDPPMIALVPQVQPVVLPKIGPSDTESLYNSCEELTMIFGNTEPSSAAIQPGKESAESIDIEFEKLALANEASDDDFLDASFNQMLTDQSLSRDNLTIDENNNSLSKNKNSPKKSFFSSNSCNTLTKNNPKNSTAPQNLKTQCILLTCIYCVMLYLQFVMLNFRSN